MNTRFSIKLHERHTVGQQNWLQIVMLNVCFCFSPLVHLFLVPQVNQEFHLLPKWQEQFSKAMTFTLYKVSCTMFFLFLFFLYSSFGTFPPLFWNYQSAHAFKHIKLQYVELYCKSIHKYSKVNHLISVTSVLCDRFY